MTAPLKRQGVWGIDLGLCALKAIRLEEENGEIHATAFDYIEHPKILSQPDADPDQLTREALEKFLSRNDLKGDLVAIGVPGQSGLARFVKLPPVDEKKIPDIVRFEAKQQIPFPLEEVVWGFQRLGSGTKTDNMILDAEIGLFAMKRDMINRCLQHFKDVNIEVHFIQMAPLALCNFLAHDLLGKGAATEAAGDDEEAADEKKCVVGLDIGADNSNLVITDGEKIIWQRPIPLGGNHFTRALTKELKLTFAKAEHLKRNAMKSPDLKKILAALKPVLNDFVSEVQRSLGYFTNTHRDANIQYMVGLGNAFRLPGLQKYLQEKLQLEVRKLQKIKRLAGDEAVTAAPQYTENVLSFAVAHGLALQGLAATRIHTNLLPPEIAQERAIRAKKPWAVLAASVLLLISPPLLLGWSVAARGYTTKNQEVATALTKLGKAYDDANGDVREFGELEKDAKKYRDEILKLSGGVNERLNWLYLFDYLNEALPRMDGSNLVLTARSGAPSYARYYYNSAAKAGPGRDAEATWNQLKEKRGKGETLTDDELQREENAKKQLVQINIEGVTALSAFTLTGKTAERKVTDITLDKTKKPNAAGVMTPVPLPPSGWVVELRGYTYHEGKEEFVRNTLVENLIDLAEVEPKDRRLLKQGYLDGQMVEEAKVDPKRMKDFKPSVTWFPEGDKILRAAGANNEGAMKPRISHIFIYFSKVDLDPLPGQFQIIYESTLAKRMNVWSDAWSGYVKKEEEVDEFGNKVEASKDPKEKKERPQVSGWRPIKGSALAEAFNIANFNGAFPNLAKAMPVTPSFGGPSPDGVPPPRAPTIQKAPRTEFIVWFIWQEPIPTGQ